MGSIPDIMFVIDTNKEAIAILEARKLNIPVIAILDTNCDPDGITYPIPGNDDAARALQLYCDLIADAVLDGLAAGQAASRRSRARCRWLRMESHRWSPSNVDAPQPVLSNAAAPEAAQEGDPADGDRRPSAEDAGR